MNVNIEIIITLDNKKLIGFTTFCRGMRLIKMSILKNIEDI